MLIVPLPYKIGVLLVHHQAAPEVHLLVVYILRMHVLGGKFIFLYEALRNLYIMLHEYANSAFL